MVTLPSVPVVFFAAYIPAAGDGLELRVRELDVEDPIELWRDGLTALDGRMDAALGG